MLIIQSHAPGVLSGDSPSTDERAIRSDCLKALSNNRVIPDLLKFYSIAERSISRLVTKQPPFAVAKAALDPIYGRWWQFLKSEGGQAERQKLRDLDNKRNRNLPDEEDKLSLSSSINFGFLNLITQNWLIMNRYQPGKFDDIHLFNFLNYVSPQEFFRPISAQGLNSAYKYSITDWNPSVFNPMSTEVRDSLLYFGLIDWDEVSDRFFDFGIQDIEPFKNNWWNYPAFFHILLIIAIQDARVIKYNFRYAQLRADIYYGHRTFKQGTLPLRDVRYGKSAIFFNEKHVNDTSSMTISDPWLGPDANSPFTFICNDQVGNVFSDIYTPYDLNMAAGTTLATNPVYASFFKSIDFLVAEEEDQNKLKDLIRTRSNLRSIAKTIFFGRPSQDKAFQLPEGNEWVLDEILIPMLLPTVENAVNYRPFGTEIYRNKDSAGLVTKINFKL